MEEKPSHTDAMLRLRGKDNSGKITFAGLPIPSFLSSLTPATRAIFNYLQFYCGNFIGAARAPKAERNFQSLK